MLIECSASTGANVKELFMQLGRMVLAENRNKLTEIDEDREHGNSLILADFLKRNNKKKQRRCCSS
jgi:hypothetical protein